MHNHQSHAKITASLTAGYSPQLMRAGTILRMGARGLAAFLHETAGINPCLRFHAPAAFVLDDETETQDFRAELHQKLSESSTPFNCRSAATFLIDNLDDNGLIEWSDDLQSEMQQFDSEIVDNALQCVQNLGPTGIAARDLQECLMLQLTAAEGFGTCPVNDVNIEGVNIEVNLKGDSTRSADLQPNSQIAFNKTASEIKKTASQKKAIMQTAKEIVQNRLHWFLRRRFDKLPKRHGRAAIALLESLSFRPAEMLETINDSSQHIAADSTADIEFHQTHGLWKPRMGNGDCRPRVMPDFPDSADYADSSDYADAAADNDNQNQTTKQAANKTARQAARESAQQYAANSRRQSYYQARQIVSAVSARRQQLLKLGQLIADRQAAFLTSGEVLDLRPFPMHTAADMLAVTPGMISHIAANKYFLLSGRIYALKLLFAQAAPGGIAVIAARQSIKNIIAHENPIQPCSDARLQKILQQRGISLARRTIGKYRAAAGIVRASLRKRASGTQ